MQNLPESNLSIEKAMAMSVPVTVFELSIFPLTLTLSLTPSLNRQAEFPRLQSPPDDPSVI
jgi:hypothetical protein